MSLADIARRIGGRATLVAVTKGRSVAEVRALYDAGQRDFAENRADALADRVAEFPDARWHFIGNLQRNKLKLLARAHLVHSFDRVDLAPAWPAGVPALMQVDLTRRADRNGIAPGDLAPALVRARECGIDVRGLTTLPPLDADPRPFFRTLRELRDELNASERVDPTRHAGRFSNGLRELSMGMTADFEVAIEEGATMVRVGRGLFE